MQLAEGPSSVTQIPHCCCRLIPTAGRCVQVGALQMPARLRRSGYTKADSLACAKDWVGILPQNAECVTLNHSFFAEHGYVYPMLFRYTSKDELSLMPLH